MGDHEVAISSLSISAHTSAFMCTLYMLQVFDTDIYRCVLFCSPGAKCHKENYTFTGNIITLLLGITEAEHADSSV